MSQKILPLRQEEDIQNVVTVNGYLKAKSITDGTDRNGKPYIRGTLTVEIGKNKTVDVDFFEGKYRSDGEESKLYIIVQKLADYVSIADLIERKEVSNETEAKALCDIVSITGQIDPNEYINSENVLVSRPKIRGKFYHRSTEKSPILVEKFGVKFDIELFFVSIKPEYVNRIETGRAIIEAVVPISVKYGKVGAMTFYVDESASAYILDNYFKNASSNVWGDFKIIEKAEEKKEGFAGATTVVGSGGFDYQWVITNGRPRQYEEGSKRDFDRKAIEEALERRLVELEQAKANKKPNKKVGFSSGKVANSISQRTREDIESRFSDDDF